MTGKTSVIGNNKYGVKLNLNFLEYIDDKIIRNGYFDQQVLDSILSRIKDKDVFWDIGANIGIHSLTIKKLKPKVKCIAFEPYYKNFHNLYDNVAINPQLNIVMVNLALGDKLGLSSLYTTENNSGRTGVLKAPLTTLINIKIPVFSSDILIKSDLVPIPNIIKIDTEGNELAVLKGLGSFLNDSTIHTIIFESFDNSHEIINYLKLHNFTSSSIDNIGNYMAVR